VARVKVWIQLSALLLTDTWLFIIQSKSTSIILFIVESSEIIAVR
jgi:hypothetical protein